MAQLGVSDGTGPASDEKGRGHRDNSVVPRYGPMKPKQDDHRNLDKEELMEGDIPTSGGALDDGRRADDEVSLLP